MGMEREPSWMSPEEEDEAVEVDRRVRSLEEGAMLLRLRGVVVKNLIL